MYSTKVTHFCRLFTLTLLSLAVNAKIYSETFAIDAIEDVFIKNGSAAYTNQDGGWGTLLVRESSNQENQSEALLKFDVPTNPSYQIFSAYIRLYIVSRSNAESGNDIVVYDVANDWDESSVTWNNAPATGAEVGSVEITDTNSNQWIEIDVSSYVINQGWGSTISFRVKRENSTLETMRFATRDNSNGNAPQLELTYVSGTNLPPEAQDVVYAIDEDGIPAPTDTILVLSSATDPDGDDLKVSKVDESDMDQGTETVVVVGAYGTLTVEENGSFQYVPDSALNSWDITDSGSDVFTVEITDQENNYATFSLTVNVSGVNDPPERDTESVQGGMFTEGDTDFQIVLQDYYFSDPEQPSDELYWDVSDLPDEWLLYDDSTRTLHAAEVPSGTAGGYTVNFAARDGGGLTSESMSVSFTILEEGTEEPPNGGATNPLVLKRVGIAEEEARIDLSAERLIIENHNESLISFVVGSTELMTIDYYEGVTVNPTASGINALNVDGTVLAKKVVVDADWADFVFDAAYELPALSEVERHIADHGRLPGVPGAEEVQANGVSIGDSQTLLLQKIEELTLYLIEEHNRVKRLQEMLERQNELIEKLSQGMQVSEDPDDGSAN